MALVLADRVKETSTTTGTGTYTLAGAVSGFESFGSIGNGNTTYYACTLGSDFEVGIGTYASSGTTLARTTILQSSNSDNAVNWGAGTKTLFCTQPAEKAVFRDASGNVSVTGDLTLTSTDASSATNPTLDLYRNSSSPAANDIMGEVVFSGENSAGEKVTYARITSQPSSVTDGSESDRLQLRAIRNGTEITYLECKFDFVTLNKPLFFNTGQNIVFECSTADAHELTLTPADVTADRTITLPDSTGTLSLLTNTETLTNKTLTTPVINGFSGTGDGSITGNLTITNTSNNGPTLSLISNDPSDVVDFGTEGHIKFFAENDASQSVEYANIEMVTRDVADGSEEGRLEINLGINGTPTRCFIFDHDNFYLTDQQQIQWLNWTSTHEYILKPTTISGTRTVLLPDASGTLSLLTNTETLTNKTLTTPVINGFSGTGDGSITGDLTLKSTDGGAAVEPILKLVRDSASPADSDFLGQISFLGDNDAGEQITYAKLFSKIIDASDGTEDGNFTFNVMSDGSSITVLNFKGNGSTSFTNKDVLLSTDVNLKFEGSSANAYETTITPTNPTQDNTLTLPNVSGTFITTGNSDSPSTTTSSSDADFVLVDDGGTMKKITPSNLGITSGGTTAAFATAMAMVL